MDFRLTDEQLAYRSRAQAVIDGVPGEQMLRYMAEQEVIGGDRFFPWAESAHHLLIEHGLVGVNWPEPYGAGASPDEAYAVEEELVGAGFPASAATSFSSTIAMIIAEGSDELVAEHLPKVLAGEWRYARGLSEAEAGSDLFAMTTSAIRDGNEYVVNGSKLWTSYAHESQWICTLVRTDPASTRQRGLSMLLIPLDAPGIEIHPVWVVGGWRVNECFFSDVRVPVTNRLGPEHEGARILSESLADERTMSFGGNETRLMLARLIHRLAGRAHEQRTSDLETLGRFVAQAEVERLLNIAVNAKAARGEESSVAGSMGKVYGSEMTQAFAEWLNELLPESIFRRAWADPDCDRLAADAEWFVRGAVTVTIVGGTSEIQRNTIATRGLQLPRGS